MCNPPPDVIRTHRYDKHRRPRPSSQSQMAWEDRSDYNHLVIICLFCLFCLFRILLHSLIHLLQRAQLLTISIWRMVRVVFLSASWSLDHAYASRAPSFHIGCRIRPRCHYFLCCLRFIHHESVANHSSQEK